MSRFAPIWNAFNAGELSPLIDGRTDQEKYFSGCKKLCNFIPTVQGPATRRGGTRFLGSTKLSRRAWFTTFEFNQAQSYVLELTDGAMRFWVNRGQLLSGGSPYEIATPWSAADLITEEGTFALRSVQSADIMWICHGSGARPPQKLSRLGATNWTLAPAPFDNGPFQDVDPDSPVTVTTSGVAGTITITASAPIFSADDIGTSFYMEQVDGTGIRTWGANKVNTVGDVRRYEGNYYRATANGGGTNPATGNSPPVHTDGRYWDGDGYTDAPNDDLGRLGVEWLYLHSGYGWAKITAVGGGGTTATATVVNANGIVELPQVISTDGTNRWAKSAFSAARGWPTSVGFFRERLVYARDRELFMSVVGDFDNFTSKDGPDITKETAIKLKIASDRLDLIRWIMPSAALLVGTARNELSVQEQTPQQVFAADNAISVPQTEYGSRLLEPIRVGNAVLFIQRAGRKLREMIYDYASDRYKADDLTVLSEHVVDAGVVDMDFQQEPDNIVWCVLTDGTMAALTYNRERGVIAWVPHVIGGPGAFVETVASISSPDGRRDDVWMVVRRTINGNTVRYVEVIEDHRLVETSTSDAFYGDGGITYDGSPTKVITGLGYLEGATVQILADGSAHAPLTVSGGQITLNRFASKVQIGFDSPAQLQTMRADGGAQDGTAQTRAKSIAEVYPRLLNTIGGLIGPAFNRLDPIPQLRPDNPVGTRPELFSGDRKIEFPATYDTDGYICLQSSPMLPLTIVSITARMEVND
jgi:hypothetical protein